MTHITNLQAQLDTIEAEIERLASARDSIRSAIAALQPLGRPRSLSPSPAPRPRTKERTIFELVAATPGQNRHEILAAMQQVCKIAPTTVSTMLSRLSKNQKIHRVEHKWYPGPGEAKTPRPRHQGQGQDPKPPLKRSA